MKKVAFCKHVNLLPTIVDDQFKCCVCGKIVRMTSMGIPVEIERGYLYGERVDGVNGKVSLGKWSGKSL